MSLHVAVLERMRALLPGLDIAPHQCCVREEGGHCLCPPLMAQFPVYLEDAQSGEYLTITCLEASPKRSQHSVLFGWNEDLTDCWFTQDHRDLCQEEWDGADDIHKQLLEAWHRARKEVMR